MRYRDREHVFRKTHIITTLSNPDKAKVNAKHYVELWSHGTVGLGLDCHCEFIGKDEWPPNSLDVNSPLLFFVCTVLLAVTKDQ